MRRERRLNKKEELNSSEDIEQYEKPNELSRPKDFSLNEKQKQAMLEAGVDVSGNGRSGTYIQVDQSVIQQSSVHPGLEIMDINEALKNYGWLKSKYFWKAVSPDADKYTKESEKNLYKGYFIRALPGEKLTVPAQSCLFMSRNNMLQNVHNVVIVEEGSELNVITGCAVDHTIRKGMHIGISEFYIKKGAKLNFTMIHNWAEGIVVRPRSVAIVEEGGVFLSNYICFKPVRSVQMNPRAVLKGKEAVARFSSILYAHPGSHMDIGSVAILAAAGTRAEVISRAVSKGGEIIARGYLKGEVAGIKAHLECRGLLLSDDGNIQALPQMEADVKEVDMSHEAAVGKIDQEQIEYLMTRGLSADEAQSAIVRGFLNVDIPGLPDNLKAQIDRAISISDVKGL